MQSLQVGFLSLLVSQAPDHLLKSKLWKSTTRHDIGFVSREEIGASAASSSSALPAPPAPPSLDLMQQAREGNVAVPKVMLRRMLDHVERAASAAQHAVKISQAARNAFEEEHARLNEVAISYYKI